MALARFIELLLSAVLLKCEPTLFADNISVDKTFFVPCFSLVDSFLDNFKQFLCLQIFLFAR